MANTRKTKKKKLIAISETFPFGSGEQFFETEIFELAKQFDEIVLFPLSVKTGKRAVPKNVSVNLSLAKVSRQISKKDIINGCLAIFSVLAYELLQSKRRKYIISKLKYFAGVILQARILGETLLKAIDQNEENFYYSFWMNDGALALALLKSNGKINSFSFRVNGYDLFDERREANYMPFRCYNFKHVENVFVLSEGALNYLRLLNFETEKLMLNRGGVYDIGQNKAVQDQKIRIVSCSNMVRLKRIDRIIEALSLLEFPVEWTHFGDGELMTELKEKASGLPANIKCIFKGHVTNKEIIGYYGSQSVDLFIHTSETEGLGLALVEAQSFGIPVVAIGVGGVPDIVSEETGVLLAPTCDAYDLAEAIRFIVTNFPNSHDFRKQIKTKCLNRFNAELNYREMYNLINSY